MKLNEKASEKECSLVLQICHLILNKMTYWQYHLTCRKDRLFFEDTIKQDRNRLQEIDLGVRDGYEGV